MWSLVLLATRAEAHTGGATLIRGQYDWSNLPDAAPGVYWVWGLHGTVIAGCAAFLLLYILMAGPWRERYGWSPVGPTRGEWRSYLISLAIVFFALQGPLHELSDKYLFSAHMVQHLLITLAFPIFFIRGIPPWMWKPVIAQRPLLAFGRAITNPPIAFVLAMGTLYLWHIPAMYDLQMQYHNLHIFEHVWYMAVFVVMWWPAYSTLPELPALTPGYRMIYLFVLTIPMKALGAILTVSDFVLYQFYAKQPRVWGLDPLADQRAGGLIMWMPGGLVFWVTIGFVFFRYFYAEVAASRAGTASPSGTAPTPAAT